MLFAYLGGKLKYAILGDLHGVELTRPIDALRNENPDVLICTGDFDQTRTIHQFMDLEREYQSAGKRVIKVPGNHDHAILRNLGITSGTLRSQGKTSFGLHEELNADPVAKRYIDELVNPKDPMYINHGVRIFLDKDVFGQLYQTIIVHGAYDGDLSSYHGCPEEIKDLWLRLIETRDHQKNFDVMDSKGDNVMVRGHDHEAVYVYEDPQKGIVAYEPSGKSSEYRLFKHRKHTINPGSLFNGIFAMIDTRVPGEDVPILRYLEL